MTTDSKSWQAISQRAVGQLPISIATSLAIESFVGIHPEKPTNKPEISGKSLLKINVRTLFRNLMGALETASKADVEVYTLAEALSNEMRAIEATIAEYSDGRCVCEFYYPTYADILSAFTRGIVKVPTTPGQRYYATLESGAIKALLTEVSGGSSVITLKREFQENNCDAVIITHYPIDLLQKYKFRSLALLESHTGVIKHPYMWNTKLYNGKEFEILPFDRMTLQMFGDGVTFTPMPIKIRQRMYGIAVKNAFTPASTKDFVIHCTVMNRDPALEVLVKDLYVK